MLSAFVNALRTPDLRRKILFTIAILAIFRLGLMVGRQLLQQQATGLAGFGIAMGGGVRALLTDRRRPSRELAARLGLPVPVYSVEAEGPDHHRLFTATVAVGDVAREGTGSSKKQAEMAAALTLWHALSDRA